MHISYAIGVQDGLGLDVLVHGEAERTDMVEYFGEKMEGICFTLNGWVQSYGSRCTRPPIFYADITRPEAMTVEEYKWAQDLTKKPVKGMLTGPVTILNWSFPRKDIPRSAQAFQLGLALREEVKDLECCYETPPLIHGSGGCVSHPCGGWTCRSSFPQLGRQAERVSTWRQVDQQRERALLAGGGKEVGLEEDAHCRGKTQV